MGLRAGVDALGTQEKCPPHKGIRTPKRQAGNLVTTRTDGDFAKVSAYRHEYHASVRIYRVFQKDMNDLNLVYFTY